MGSDVDDIPATNRIHIALKENGRKDSTSGNLQPDIRVLKTIRAGTRWSGAARIVFVALLIAVGSGMYGVAKQYFQPTSPLYITETCRRGDLVVTVTATGTLDTLIYRGSSRRKRRTTARHALQLVGLFGRESHTPAELSGGQQQRVAIARALVTEPAVILADEPTGNLDSARSQEIMELLVNLNDEQGITVLLVTHEAEMAKYAKRRLTFLDGRLQSDESIGVARECSGT
jgi:ABC-type dipeptide/oligopeptide/nickel transport system ATPase subunit